MTESPADLLGDLRQLRRKVRRDRHGYAFPLLLFGFLILAASLCYSTIEVGSGEYVILRPPGPFPVFGFHWAPLSNVVLVQWYWMLALLSGFAATVWWYRRRALQVGIETGLSGYLIAGGAGVVGLVFGEPVLASSVLPRTVLYAGMPEFNLLILVVAAAASIVAFLLGVRRRHWRDVTVPAGTLFAMIAFSAVGVYLINGFAALLIIAVALLTLAWVERSALLATVGVLFAAVSVQINVQGIAFYFAGLHDQDGRLVALTDLALPGGVLIIGGVIALLQSRQATTP
jgi:hypothetical protein